VNWFERKRAMAVGVAMIGLSISGAFMIPAASWGVETWGWRAVFEAFALAGLALIPLIAWLVVTRPSDMGLTPDGEVQVSSSTPTAEADSPAPSSLGSLLASPSLWLIGAVCGLAYLGALPVMNHGIAFAIDRGIDPMRAAALLSAISLGAAAGKLVFGWLSDRLGEKLAFGVTLAVQFMSLFGLWALSTYASLVVAGAFFGLGLGGIAPLQAALLARGFGSQDFSRVMGLLGPLMTPFLIIGPPLAGYIFDTRGSYDLAIWIFMGTTLAAAVVLGFLRLPPAPAGVEAEIGDEPEPSGSTG
jgi:MFS family permease